MKNKVSRAKGHLGKWLELKIIKDQELILRSTDERYYAGVTIFAISKSKPKKLLVISNYRCAPDKKVLEIPAGLAEKDLTVKENALKELREETGVIYFYSASIPRIYRRTSISGGL